MPWGIGNATEWEIGQFLGVTGGGGDPVDTVPPSFVGVPYSSNITYLSFLANFTLNETAVAYGIVVPVAAPTPSPAEIVAGNNYGTTTVLAVASAVGQPNIPNVLNFSNVPNSAEAQLRVFLTAQDYAGNIQSAFGVRSIDITMGAVPVTGGGGTGGGEPKVLLSENLIYEVM